MRLNWLCLLLLPLQLSAKAFSWATVPLYNELANINATLPAGEFSPAMAAYLSSNFSLVVLEHAQGQRYCYDGRSYGPLPFAPPTGVIEDHFAAAARQLKALDPATLVLFYQNANALLPYYRWAANVTSNPSRCTSSGAHMMQCVPVTWAWNHSSPTTLPIWQAGLAAAAPELDGMYVDTAGCRDPAELQTLASLQKAFPSKIIGFHDFNVGAACGGNASGALRLSQTYTFGEGGAADVAWVAGNERLGVTSLCHAQTTAGTALQNYSLALFLAAAGNFSMYAFSSFNSSGGGAPWEFCNPRSPTAPAFPTWCAGQGWSADFEKPLGAPRGPAAPTGGKKGQVAREFASGTRVTVDVGGSFAEIAWADGSFTRAV